MQDDATAKKEYHKEWYWKHKEEVRRQHREYYNKSKDKINRKRRDRRIAEGDAVREREGVYRSKRKYHINECAKQWYEQNRDQVFLARSLKKEACNLAERDRYHSDVEYHAKKRKNAADCYQRNHDHILARKRELYALKREDINATRRKKYAEKRAAALLAGVLSLEEICKKSATENTGRSRTRNARCASSEDTAAGRAMATASRVNSRARASTSS